MSITTVVPPGTPGPLTDGGAGLLPNVTINDPTLRLLPGDSQRETTIAAWGNVVVAGWIDCSSEWTDDTLRNGANAWGFSTDGGQTWRDFGRAGALPLVNNGPNPPRDPGTRGDPSLDVDTNGNFYYASLYKRSTDTTLQVSVHKGHYDTGSGSVVFPNPPKILTNFTTGGADKEHIGVDKSTGYIYVSYTNFSIPNTHGQIEIVRSTNGGEDWSAPVILAPASTDRRQSHQGSVPRFGPQGEVYVVWEDGWPTVTGGRSIHLRKSTALDWPNFGPDITVDTVYPVRLPPFFDKIQEFPTLAVDTTPGPNRGRVYVAWNDARYGGTAQIGSILLSSSTDLGSTWSVPIEVNDDGHPSSTGTDHWLPWMGVDGTGVLRIAWYDRRLRDPINNPAWTDVFVGSFAGATRVAADRRITTQSFPMNVSHRCAWGDYIGAYTTAGRFHVCWTDSRNMTSSGGGPDVFGGGFLVP